MIWNSPDETAQAFFIKWFAEHGSFAYPEPLNFVTQNLIHPRSTVVVDGFIVPGGFMGLPLFYGSLMKVFGEAVLWVATPILTVLALWAFFRLVRVVWGRSVAWIATIAFAAHPAVIYYTARGLFPNMVFVDLVILGAMFLITPPLAPPRGGGEDRDGFPPLLKGRLGGVNDLLGAACVGAALLVRFSEIVWVAPLWIALAWIGRKGLSWQRVAVWVAVLAIFFGLQGFLNHSLYGKPWSFGYNAHSSREGSSWIMEDQIDEATLRWADGPAALIFPFGFHPARAARIAATYAYRLFPLWAALAVIGFFLWLRSSRTREQKIWVWVTLAVGAWLMVYYGSWLFSDHPNPQAVTIGTSYMRYWLPVFGLLAPLVGKGVLMLARRLAPPLAPPPRGGEVRKAVPPLPPAGGEGRVGGVLAIALAGAFVIFGLKVAVWSPEEGLIAVRENIKTHQTIRAQVFAIVPKSGIIITDRHDKFFFPDRRVVVGLRNPETLAGLQDLVKHGPVYYYGVTMLPYALAETNAQLEPHGAVLKAKTYFGPEALYEVSQLQRTAYAYAR